MKMKSKNINKIFIVSFILWALSQLGANFPRTVSALSKSCLVVFPLIKHSTMHKFADRLQNVALARLGNALSLAYIHRK